METYTTLSFKSKIIAIKNMNDIKNHFGNRVVNSEIKIGTDERNNYGYYVEYSLT